MKLSTICIGLTTQSVALSYVMFFVA